MKLLLANHEYPPVGGGAATATQALAQNFHALGHEVTVLTARHDALSGISNEAGIVVRRVRCVRTRVDRSNVFEMLTFALSALFALPLILLKTRPDGLIVFFSLPSGPLGLVAKLFFGIPYIVSLRGGDVPGLVPEMDSLHKIVAPLRRLVLKRAVAVVANSEALRKLSQISDHGRVVVIPNGVDTGFFRANAARSTSSSARRPLHILFVGRLHEQKNLSLLWRQLARLPGDSFELQVVGDGPQREHFRGLAKELGIANQISWRGWLPRSELPAVYQSADCLVNPSSYEGMPNVVLEAMASGVPVIASKIDSHIAIVVDGETGLLFDLSEPNSLISAFKRMHDVEFRERMGTRARARAEKFLSWESVASAYVGLFRASPMAKTEHLKGCRH